MDQAAFLQSLGLNPEAPGLVTVAAEVEPNAPAKPGPAFPKDAHTMSVTDIPWGKDKEQHHEWLDGFPNLEGAGMAAASRYLFEQFKSPHKDKDRNSLLHSQIGLFINAVRTQRRLGGITPVTDKIKAGKPEREMAAILAATGITPEMLAEMILASQGERMMAWADYKKQLADSRERFLADTKEHKLTVLKDDGLYRHLRFKKPGTSFYWYDIVTWPGNLMIRGDMGAFAFARLDDMFEFFRSGADINPGYWAEKLTAPDPDGAKAYSETFFRAQVKQAYEYRVEARGEDPALWKRVEWEILDSEECYDETMARALLRDFSDDSDLFADSWEWDLTDFTHRFLWCCHAIRHAITAYDERQA